MMEALQTWLDAPRENATGCTTHSLHVKPGEVLVVRHPKMSEEGIKLLANWGNKVKAELGCRVLLLDERLHLDKLVIEGGGDEFGRGEAVSGKATTSTERILEAHEIGGKGRRLIAQVERWLSSVERRIDIADSSGTICRELLILRAEGTGRLSEFKAGKRAYREMSEWFESHRKR